MSSDHSLAGEAFVTLVTSDSYCMGAIVVAKSLKRHGTTRSVVVMVTPNVSEQKRWVMVLAMGDICELQISADMAPNPSDFMSH